VYGPVLGYLTEAGKAIRPVLGVPGAAHIGDSLNLPAFALASASPEQDYLLGVEQESRNLVLVTLRDFAIQGIENARPNATRIVPSPSNNTAAVYFKDTATIQVLTGLPHAAKVEYEFQVPDEIGVMAVNSDGSSVLYSTAEGEREGLFSRTGSGEIQRLGSAGKVAALAFAPSSSDAAVTDSAAQEVLLIRGGAVERLAGEREGILNPAAVAFSTRGVLVVNEGTGSVGLLPLDGGMPRFTACECTAKLLRKLSRDIFQLTENTEETVYILDGRLDEAKVWFVPTKLPDPEAAP
jgi:hypothetical protein